MKSWYTIRARASGTEVLIYDEIGAYGVTAKGFLAELGALPGDAAIDLRLNSPGGSVFDAVAIYNALKRHAGEITVWIDGIAASAASYIAMAGDIIVMPENAFLMIHDPSGMVMGTAGDMRAMAEALEKIGASLNKGYAAKSGKSEKDIAALMAAETWFDAADALDMGFADTMSVPVRIAASFDVSQFQNTPPEIIEAVKPADKSEVSAKATPFPAQAQKPDPVPDPISIRAEAMTYAKTVVDLCRLAGQPQMAASFLTAETSLDSIHKALIDAKAANEPDISSTHPQPGPSPEAKPWGDVIARTFKRKG